ILPFTTAPSAGAEPDRDSSRRAAKSSAVGLYSLAFGSIVCVAIIKTPMAEAHVCVRVERTAHRTHGFQRRFHAYPDCHIEGYDSGMNRARPQITADRPH